MERHNVHREGYDAEKHGEEYQPLIPKKKSREASSASSASSLKKTGLLRTSTKAYADINVLSKLLDIDYVQDHFPNLNASEVSAAAKMIDECVDISQATGTVTSKLGNEPDESEEERKNMSMHLREAIMFKNRPVKSCTLLHFAIWFVAEFGVDVELVQCVLDSLQEPDEVFLPGMYVVGSRGGDQKKIYFSCVHLAAGLGQLETLKVLCHHAANATSDETMMSPEQFVTQWAKIPIPPPQLKDNPTAAEEQTHKLKLEAYVAPTDADYLDPSQDFRFTKFYQPIHDSSFQGYGEVTLWLLRQKAECTKNKDKITPLHFLAFSGISGSHDQKLGENLRDIVKALTESGRRGEGVTSVADMKNFIPGAISVTPLEVAVEDASRFPQEHLGLLAPCLSEGHHLSYFEDIKRIADRTSEGALNLVRTIAKSGKRHQHVLRRFRINAQKPGSSDKLASIFYTSPLAASEMLDLLNVEPEVEDPGRHGVPARTSMWGLVRNVPMKCAYQIEAINKDNLMVPYWAWKTKDSKDRVDTSWHSQFLPRPSRQARGAHIKSIRLVTCLLPNILDMDIFMAFVHCQREHIATMNSKNVQGAIYCLWGNLMERSWLMDVTFRAAEVVAYVHLAVIVAPGEARDSLAWTLVAGGAFYQLILLFCCMWNILRKWNKCKQMKDGDTLQSMWSPVSNWAIGYFVPTFFGISICMAYVVDLAFNTGDRGRFDDRLLAICLLLSCCRFIWAWRMSNVGATIYTIAETCLAAAVNQVLFITCMLLFSIILALMVLSRFHTVGLAVSAYRGFMFGDDYGFHDLGMDIGHDSAFAAPDGVLLFASVCGAFFFNVIVLNIIIAIYGHEYEKNQQNTPMLFMIGRADYCVKTVLSCHVIPWTDETRHYILLGAATFILVSGVVVGSVRPHEGTALRWLSAVLVAVGLALLRMALVQCDWFSPEGGGSRDLRDQQRYLWIAHSHDWQQSFEDEEDKLEEHVENLTETMQEEIGDVKHQVRELDDKLAELCAVLHMQRTPKTTKTVGRSESMG